MNSALSTTERDCQWSLEIPLRVINQARGTHHMLKSLAEECGVDIEDATCGDVSVMATYIGGTLLAEARP